MLVHGLTVDRRVMIDAFDGRSPRPACAGCTSICRATGASPGDAAQRLAPTRSSTSWRSLVRASWQPGGPARDRRARGATRHRLLLRRLPRARPGARARRRARALARAVPSSSPTSRGARSRRGVWRRASRVCRSRPIRASARRSSRWRCSMTRAVLAALSARGPSGQHRRRRGGGAAVRARYALSRPLGDALPGSTRRRRSVRPRRSLGRLAGRDAAGGAQLPRAALRGAARLRPSLAVRAARGAARAVAATGCAASLGATSCLGYVALPLTAETVTMICVCWISSLTSIFTQRLGPRRDVVALLLDELRAPQGQPGAARMQHVAEQPVRAGSCAIVDVGRAPPSRRRRGSGGAPSSRRRRHARSTRRATSASRRSAPDVYIFVGAEASSGSASTSSMMPMRRRGRTMLAPDDVHVVVGISTLAGVRALHDAQVGDDERVLLVLCVGHGNRMFSCGAGAKAMCRW